jgi:GST-like protein
MIDLYTFATGNGQRASVMLEACGLPYRVHRVDLRRGEQNAAEFRRINPAGAIPVIVDADGPGGRALTLSQSAAIMLYLAEKTGRFLPREGIGRASTLQWFAGVMTDPAAASSSIFMTGLASDPPPAEAVRFWEARLITLLQPYDAQLAGQDWLAGELSIADLALYPTYAARRPLIENGQGLTHLKRWAARLGALPEVQRGMAVPG